MQCVLMDNYNFMRQLVHADMLAELVTQSVLLLSLCDLFCNSNIYF